jgi:hypothetical protein
MVGSVIRGACAAPPMEIRTEIEIEAPPAEVWRVLADFPRYPEWNPLYVSAIGKLEPGARLSLVESEPESHRERSTSVRVTRCDPERELRWLGHSVMKGLLDGEHFLVLEATPDGHTRVVHGENATGILLRFALARITLKTRGLVYMNQALKRRVESLSGARTSWARADS